MVQYATSRLQTLNIHITTTDFSSVDEVLLGTAPYPVDLHFMSMEGQIKYIDLIRIGPLYFDGYPRFDVYFLTWLT